MFVFTRKSFNLSRNRNRLTHSGGPTITTGPAGATCARTAPKGGFAGATAGSHAPATDAGAAAAAAAAAAAGGLGFESTLGPGCLRCAVQGNP